MTSRHRSALRRIPIFPCLLMQLVLLLLLIFTLESAEGWTPLNTSGRRWLASPSPPLPPNPVVDDTTRRDLWLAVMAATTATTMVVVVTPSVSQAAAGAQRAVGSGEIACREAGNCLQVGEWDGAVGWGWGGKDRCDAADPLCGTDGKLRETALVGKPVPRVPTIAPTLTATDSAAVTATTAPTPVRFTHIAAIQIEVGRGEVGVLKLGFYGNEVPTAVAQLVDFLSTEGFNAVSAASSKTSNRLGVTQPLVSLQTGGLVSGIVPNTLIELGVPSQANAYARSLGRSKVSDTFVPQPRPPPLMVSSSSSSSSSSQKQFIRPHDCAGLVSVAEQGLGYGGTGFESIDECYESAFSITADAVPSLDAKRRVVVGQVLDADSMAFLERLANIPTKRGIRGVIPGQTAGPPLPKVVVRQIQVAKVTAP